MKLLREMMFTLFVAGVLFIDVLLLTACAGPYKITHESDRTTANITVQWMPAEKIAAACDPLRKLPRESIACFTSEGVIITRKPKDWNDEAALLSLGHEVYHALGAEHNLMRY